MPTVTKRLTAQSVRLRMEAATALLVDEWNDRNELTEIDRLLANLEERIVMTSQRDFERSTRKERWALADADHDMANTRQRNAHLRQGGHIRVDAGDMAPDVELDAATAPEETVASSAAKVVIEPPASAGEPGFDGEEPTPPPILRSGRPPEMPKASRKKK